MTPGEAELAARELCLADEALRACSLILDAGGRESAASRLYYATFHAARAALAVRGVYAKTHSGQISLFGETYEQTPLLGQLLELRAKADYGREEFTESIDELRRRLAEAQAFVHRCRAIVGQALREGPDESDPPPDY